MSLRMQLCNMVIITAMLSSCADSKPGDVPADSTPADVPVDSTPADVPVDSTPADVPVDSTPADVPVDSTPADVPVDVPPADAPPDISDSDGGGFPAQCPAVKPRCFSGLSCGVADTPSTESRWATFAFDAFDYTDHDGVSQVAADLDGDGKAELITARRSETARPFELRIYKVFVGTTPGGATALRNALWIQYTSDTLPLTKTVNIAVGRFIPGNADVQIATASRQDGADARLDVWAIQTGETPTLTALSTKTLSGVDPNLAAVDVNGDGVDELVVTSGSGDSVSQLSIFQLPNTALVSNFEPVPGATKGLHVAVGDVNGNGVAELVVGLGPAAGNDSKLRAYELEQGALKQVATWDLLAAGSYGAVPLVGNFLASESGPERLEVAAVTGASEAGENSLPVEIVIADACGQAHHTIRPEFFEDTFYLAFNGGGPSLTMQSIGAGDDTTTLLDGLAPGGLGPHFRMVNQIGGHYLAGTYIHSDKPKSADPKPLPDETFYIQNGQKDSHQALKLADYLAGKSSQAILSSPYNHWSVKPGDPWVSNTTGVLAARYLTLDKNQFMVTNQGENWRDLLYPDFDPLVPSAVNSDTKGLFYWNISTLKEAGGIVNKVFHWRDRIHRDRMRFQGKLLRTYPNYLSRFDLGGELEFFSGNFNKGKFYGSRYGDYSVFALTEFRQWLQERYASLDELKTKFELPFASWDAVDPPRGTGFGDWPDAPWNCIRHCKDNKPGACLVNPWWDEWHAFRVEQVRRITEYTHRVANEEGIPPHRIGSHQIPGTVGVGGFKAIHDSHWASPLETASSQYGRLGITTYGAAALSPLLWEHVAKTSVYGSIGEYNPMPPPQHPNGQNKATILNALNMAWDGGMQSVAYHTWHVEYGIFDTSLCKPNCSWLAVPPSPLDPNSNLTPAVEALMEFIATHAYQRRLRLGSGATVSVADFDGDGLHDLATNLGARVDSRTEALIKVWHSVIEPFTPTP